MANKKLLLAVAFDDENNVYSVDVPSGSSVPECAFCMTVVIKCLVRDGIIKSADEVLGLIKKYIDDSQYEEVKPAEEVEVDEDGKLS